MKLLLKRLYIAFLGLFSNLHYRSFIMFFFRGRGLFVVRIIFPKLKGISIFFTNLIIMLFTFLFPHGVPSRARDVLLRAVH